MASRIFALLKTTLQQALAEKTYLDGLVLLYLGCIFVKRSEKSNISIHSEFINFEIYLYFVSLPAVRPGYARYMAPDFSHNKGNHVGFTKMLFRLRFVHCTIACPLFYLLHLIFLDRKMTKFYEGVNIPRKVLKCNNKHLG